MKVVFDTETTGLNPCENEIAQLSYIMVDDNYEIKTAKNFYFSVDYVEPGASHVNGLTKKVLDELSEGKKFEDFAEEIYCDFLSSETLIAHNIEFDLSFIREEFKRLNYDIYKLNENKKYCCTMHEYTDILKINHKYHGYKYPRLDEVMWKLNVSREHISNMANDIFEIEDIGYHDARFDIVATLIAYKSLEHIEKYMTCYDTFKHLNWANRSIREINDYYKGDISILDIENLNEIYNELIFNKDRWSLKELISDEIKNLENAKKCIEMEEQRLINNRKLELAKMIEDKINKEEIEIIKGVFYEDYNFGKHTRKIAFNVQVGVKFDYGFGDVDLIKLDDNMYIVIFDEYIDDCSIITVSNDVSKRKETGLECDEFEVLNYEDVPECTNIEDIERNYKVNNHVLIKEMFKKKNEPENISNNNENDDEIPF